MGKKMQMIFEMMSFADVADHTAIITSKLQAIPLLRMFAKVGVTTLAVAKLRRQIIRDESLLQPVG